MIRSAILLSVGLLLSGLMTSADVVNVKALNQKLEKENQSWRAKDTWVNRLSDLEIKRMLGNAMVPDDVEFLSSESEAQWGSLPKSVDWRNKDGKNWVSPILNQGACGSCVSFAAIGALETQVNISSLLPSLNRRLSTQQLFSCGGGMCGRGWYIESAVSYLKSKGVADEACMPYVSGATGEDVACNQACSDSSSRSLKLAGSRKPTFFFRSLNAIKKALQKGPLVTSMTVYSDFLTYSSGVYKSTSNRREGGHAISIVGYDDSKNALIIRNSWGVDWGENGFAYIDYKDKSGIGNQTWLFEVPAMNSVISMESPLDRDFISGAFPLKSTNNISSAAKVRYTVVRADQSVVASYVDDEKAASTTLDTSSMADGKYQIRVEALDRNDRTLAQSTHQYFYVVNNEPELSIALNVAGIDFTKDLSGRIELEINAKTSSVPMTSYTFHYKNADGKEIQRTTLAAASSMRAGWRTPAVSNGTYEIWMSGRLKSNAIDKVVESAHYKVNIKN